MKYFTPELFIQLQECDTPSDVPALSARWENAVAAYRANLEVVRPRMRGALLRFVQRGSLHDARVLDIGVAERKVTLVVQEEVAPTLLFLTYSLVDAPEIDRSALPEQHRSPDPMWLYDEFDLEAQLVFHPRSRILERVTDVPAADGNEWKSIFLHSILLSNGWEVRLRFHALTVTRTNSLLRSDVPVHPAEDSLSRSA